MFDVFIHLIPGGGGEGSTAREVGVANRSTVFRV